MLLILRIMDGPDEGTVFRIASDAPFTIGRGNSCQGKLTDSSVSRAHCQIDFDGAQFILKNLSTTSGTMVNGGKIDESELRQGDVIKVGNTRFQTQLLSGPDESTVSNEEN